MGEDTSLLLFVVVVVVVVYLMKNHSICQVSVCYECST